MKHFILTLSVFFLVLLISGCNKDEEIIKIGAILPETGNAAQLGLPKKEAFLLAENQINSKRILNGKKIKIIIGDNQGDAKLGVNLFTKFSTTENIDIMYVDITRVANACLPLSDKYKKIMFAGSAQPGITEGHPWAFRIFTSGDQETSIINSYLKEKSVRTIYILYVDDVLGEYNRKYLTEKFQKIGGRVLGSDAFKLGEIDCRNILIKAKNSGAEKLIMFDYGVTIPNLVTQANELKIPNNRIIGNIGFVGPRVAELKSALLDGIVFTGPSYSYKHLNPQTNELKDFINSYKELYNKTPDYTAAFAYDTIILLTQIIQENGMDITKIRDGLKKVKDFQGISGKISILPNGDSITETELMIYKNGIIKPFNN